MKMGADAIVNAADTGLLMGGGVCGAIFDPFIPAKRIENEEPVMVWTAVRAARKR